METRFINADIVIIGGGSAGCMAAIRALELNPGLKVAIFEKGDIKYSGSIARGMDALNIVTLPKVGTPNEYLESSKTLCQNIVDEPASFEMANRSYSLLKKLEDWNVCFPKSENGQYQVLQYMPKGKFQVTMDEPDLKTMIAERAVKAGATVFNRIMGLRVLTESNTVSGVVGLNVRSGDLIVCKAQAVILSAGGLARLTLPNSGSLYSTFDYPGNSGDGLIMAYRAGAEVIGLECARRMVVIKDVSIPLLAITINRGGQMIDVFDQVLMEGHCWEKSKQNEAIQENRTPLRIRLTHLPGKIIDEIEHYLFTTERPVQERFFKGRGIDFRKNDIELWPTEYQLCGGHGMTGVRVNKNAQTNISGLFAAGDTAAVPYGHLTGAFVFGEISAETAVRHIENSSRAQIHSDEISKIESERDARLNSRGQVDLQLMEYKFRRLVDDYLVPPKNAYKLNRMLDWAKIFAQKLGESMIRNGHELSKLYELENIITCAKLSALASLERKESRWSPSVHYRTDFPERNDDEFMYHIALRENGVTGEPKIAKSEILTL